jgi:hypothetical protein
MTGLRIAADKVLELVVRASADFLAGKSEEIKKRAVVYEPKPNKGELPVKDGRDVPHHEDGEEVGKVPKPYRPVGKPGGLMWHRFD